jgi:multiple sugar transport system substrate-binding protein
MRLRANLLALAAAGSLVVGVTNVGAAQEIELLHDKSFWAEALQVVGDAAGEATGNSFSNVIYSPAAQYQAFIRSSVASGEMPEFFTWWTGGVYRDLIESGAVGELDGIWDGLIADGLFSEATRDFYTVGDHVYGVPLHLSRWIGLYNKAQFADAGIDGEPQTWAELLDAADKLKAAGFTPFLSTVQNGWRGFIWFEEIMIRTDPEAYNGLHDGSVAYDSEPVRNAFNIWVDWYEKGYFSDPRSIETVPDFARGEGAIYLIGDWAVGLVEETGMVPGEDFGAFIFPNMDASLPSSAILEGGPIMLSAEGVKNPDVVAALKYFLSVEGANVWAEASGNAIGNMKADPPNVLVAKINKEVAAKGTLSMERWWEAVPADLQGELVAEFNRFMLDPTMDTAEDVMANIQSLNADYWADQ